MATKIPILTPPDGYFESLNTEPMLSRFLSLAAIFLLSSFAALSQVVNFKRHPYFYPLPSTSHLEVNDLNGDGVLDIVGAGNYGVAILINHPDQKSDLVTFTIPYAWGGIGTGDFDGDGDIDIASVG